MRHNILRRNSFKQHNFFPGCVIKQHVTLNSKNRVSAVVANLLTRMFNMCISNCTKMVLIHANTQLSQPKLNGKAKFFSWKGNFFCWLDVPWLILETNWIFVTFIPSFILVYFHNQIKKQIRRFHTRERNKKKGRRVKYDDKVFNWMLLYVM